MRAAQRIGLERIIDSARRSGIESRLAAVPSLALGSAEVKTHLKRLADGGAGLLVSSHILSDVEEICDRILILSEGKRLLCGQCDTILALRDRFELRFKAPGQDGLLEEIKRLIESRGGTVEFAGHPTAGLESLFKKILEEHAPFAPGADP